MSFVLQRVIKCQCVLFVMLINNLHFLIFASGLLALLSLPIVDNYDKQWRNHSAWVPSLEIVPDASLVPVR
jgi:hypothetical protein